MNRREKKQQLKCMSKLIGINYKRTKKKNAHAIERTRRKSLWYFKSLIKRTTEKMWTKDHSSRIQNLRQIDKHQEKHIINKTNAFFFSLSLTRNTPKKYSPKMKSLKNDGIQRNDQKPENGMQPKSKWKCKKPNCTKLYIFCDEFFFCFLSVRSFHINFVFISKKKF